MVYKWLCRFVPGRARRWAMSSCRLIRAVGVFAFKRSRKGANPNALVSFIFTSQRMLIKVLNTKIASLAFKKTGRKKDSLRETLNPPLNELSKKKKIDSRDE